MSIKVTHLSKIYDTQRAVDDISFEVKKGEVLGFLGPNGAGKSTTMKILTCFIPQTEGKAYVCELDTMKDSLLVRKKIGYLPEHNPLYPDMYVKEYLEMVARLHELNGNKSARISEMIGLTGLTLEQHKKIGALSKGYRQRVGLAQAMLHNPEVLILDEPTSGLDPNQLVEIRNLIRELGKEKTVIFSTHIMQEVQAICNRVIIINKGKIVVDDDIHTLQQKMAGETIVSVEFKEDIEKQKLTEYFSNITIQEIGKNKWKFSAKKNTALREKIFHFAVEKKLTLLGMSLEKQSLEDVFQSVTKLEA